MSWLNQVTAWQVSSTRSGKGPPAEAQLADEGRYDRLVLVGPGSTGWVYQSSLARCWYRLILLTDMPLELRNQTRSYVNRPVPAGVAPITKAWQPEALPSFFCIRYAGEAACPQDRSLAAYLADPDPFPRLDAAIQVLRTFPGWWHWWRDVDQSGCRRPLLPVPTEMVIGPRQVTYLYPPPCWPMPRPVDVFAEPGRALYLAPELVRSTVRSGDSDGWTAFESIDRYALGMALLQCFYAIGPEHDGAAALHRAANQSFVSTWRLQTNLPFWMEQLEPVRRARSLVRQLLHPDSSYRAGADLASTADQLSELRRKMEPSAAAIALRDSGQPGEAFSLLQHAMLTHESCDLLVLAAEIAVQMLQRPLEAVDLLERAINREPLRLEAYASQLQILSAAEKWLPLCDLMARNEETGRQIDAKVDRDFAKLSGPNCHSLEVKVARYLLWRQHWQQAAAFTYERLRRAKQWDFELNLAYAKALIRLRSARHAQAQMARIRDELRKVSPSERAHYGREFAELEAELQALLEGPGGEAAPHPTEAS